MKEIKILGAGISGLTAAINLAEAGYEVRVYEKAKYVGARHHGDFQGLENWTTEKDILRVLEECNVKTDFFHEPFKKPSWYSPSLNRALMESDEPFFYLIKRGKEKGFLDRSLKQQAESLGVEIEFRTEKQEAECDIIATGPKKANAWALGMNFESGLPRTAMAVLNDKIAPNGYAYLLSVNGKCTLAAVCFGNSKPDHSYLGKTIKEFKKLQDFKIRNKRRFVGHGNFFIPRSAKKNNTIYVGERAGFQDYLFGFGMKYAFLSGYLAAKAITESKNYDRLWRHKFLGELRGTLVSGFLFNQVGNKGYEKLVKRLKGKGREVAKKGYEFPLGEKLIYPIAKLII